MIEYREERKGGMSAHETMLPPLCSVPATVLCCRLTMNMLIDLLSLRVQFTFSLGAAELENGGGQHLWGMCEFVWRMGLLF